MSFFFWIRILFSPDRDGFFVRDPIEADWSSFVARVCGFAEQSGFMLNECVRVS